MAIPRHALRERRQRLGITQRKLAALTGIHPVTYNRIERGHKMPDVAMAIRILAALDLDLSRANDIFALDEPAS
ncbi:MAG: helix-turn-helix transcriptional regulator [Thermaerobacter sp.]|nr:helix-turn-helix transcriptional regulator [Thermaerobacter sp.]